VKRNLVSIAELEPAEIEHLLALGERLKGDLKAGRPHVWLPGKTLAMIFEKPSLRTRVTFETGMHQLGGDAIYLAPGDIHFGQRESVTDIGKNLSCWVDAIVARTFSHRSLVDLADAATVPVINGLTDLLHPCQVLADCLTLQELRGDVSKLHVAFVGDGNNVVHSWLHAAAKLGFDFTLVCPKGYEPDAEVLATTRATARGRLEVTNDIVEGPRGADVLYTDVWTSMGQEAESARRRKVFAPYQLNAEVVARAAKDVIVMHCLPAHRGEEITSDVLDGPNSVVVPQAENRMHLQKALLAWLLRAKEAQP
jgi:ornithine carbamoyltransferase